MAPAVPPPPLLLLICPSPFSPFFPLASELQKLSNQQSLNVTLQYEGMAVDCLCLCLQEGHVEVLRALLDFGEPVEADALLQAVRHGHGHLLHFLLDSGVDINHTSSDRGYNTGGMTALHEAAVLGSGQMVADLLAAGADVHRRKLNGTSALYTAAQLGHDDVVRCLLEAGAHPCSGGPMPNGPCPLYWPAASGYLSVAGQLLKAGAKPDDCYNSTTGLYALEAAVSAGHDEVVALLLAYGASASTGLHAAVRARKPALVRRLLDSGADPNVVSTHLHSPDPSTPLLAAAEMGDMESARMLLDAGAAASNPSLLGINGFSPLQAAAAKGHRDMVALLLASGSDPNFRDGARKGTAVYLAALHGHGGAVEQLLVAGADVNTAHQGTGAAPLYAAASCNHLAVVEQLLRAGANVNAHCSQGLTALHMAARCPPLPPCPPSGYRVAAPFPRGESCAFRWVHPTGDRPPLDQALERERCCAGEIYWEPNRHGVGGQSRKHQGGEESPPGRRNELRQAAFFACDRL